MPLEEKRKALAMKAQEEMLRQHLGIAGPSKEGWAKDTEEFARMFRHFRLGTPWFHRLWYSAFDNPELTHIYVQSPREHGKTSAILTYALRRLCENHSTRIGIISGTDTLAKKFLTELKHELESNQDLIRLYNEGQSFVGPKWTEHELVLAGAYKGEGGISGKDVSVFSVGRGTQISSRHCDLLIADDVESADSVKSETVRQNTREWWAREVAPVLSPGGKFCVTGTRKSFQDIYSRLIADDTWTVLDQAKTVWKEDDEPIWPEMWDKTSLLKRKVELDAQDVLAWPQEYLNQPLPSETQMFHPESWPTYFEEPHSLAARAGMTVLQFWDLAISEKTTADFTCGVTVAADEENNIYMLEVRRGHWDFARTLTEIGSLGHNWPDVAGVGIEQVAYQAAAVQEAARRTMLPVIPIVPDKDKVTRARLLEARANIGKVYRPAICSWWSDFAQELSYFPDPGSHDDQVDAMASVVKMAGWSAESIGWAYNIWTCLGCSHMFTFDPGRPCPKCGRKAPDTYGNPELVAMGGLLEEQLVGPSGT